MSVHIRSSYPDAVDLSIAAENYLLDAYAQYPMPFLQYFDVVDMPDGAGQSQKISHLGGVPALPETGENSDYPEATMVEGYDKTLTPLKYAHKIEISEELAADDPKGVFSMLESQINAHYKGATQRACIVAATILNTATSTAGPDGQFIIDTDHPTSPSNATTLSNEIDTKLDQAGLAIKEMYTKIATNGKDMAGNQILFGKWLLVVPPALKYEALRACTAIYGTPFAVSNVGVFQGVVGGLAAPSPIQTGELFRTSTTTGSTIQVVEDPFLGSGYTNGSDVKWYLVADPAQAKGKHSLRFIWRQMPALKQVTIDPDTQAISVPFSMRCVAGAVDWRHLWGSNGTA